jgi:hypothetical protein
MESHQTSTPQMSTWGRNRDVGCRAWGHASDYIGDSNADLYLE